jgi:hypothetical protein
MLFSGGLACPVCSDLLHAPHRHHGQIVFSSEILFIFPILGKSSSPDGHYAGQYQERILSQLFLLAFSISQDVQLPCQQLTTILRMVLIGSLIIGYCLHAIRFLRVACLTLLHFFFKSLLFSLNLSGPIKDLHHKRFLSSVKDSGASW